MTTPNNQSGAINKALRWVFGVRVKAPVDITDIQISQQSDVVQIEMQLSIPQAGPSLILLSPAETFSANSWLTMPDLSPAPSFWSLIVPDVARLHYSLLIDVPGRYQFPGSILLRKPHQLQMRLLDETPKSLDLTNKFVRGWRPPPTKNAIQLLTNAESPQWELPNVSQLPQSLLQVDKPHQSRTEFELSSDYLDLSNTTLKGWQSTAVEDLFLLLTDETQPLIEFPKLSDVDQDLLLPVQDVENVDHTFREADFSAVDVLNVFLLRKDEDFVQLFETPPFTISPPEQLDGDKFFLVTPDSVAFAFKLVMVSDDVELIEPQWPQAISEDMLDIIRGQGDAGKSYDEQADTLNEPDEPVTDLDSSICKHGISKATCAICQEQSKKDRERTKSKGAKPRTINPFDLLLPFLYPPLGHNFDNILALPPGKKLYGFQVEGARFLVNQERALLGDEMGLGKSIQAIFATRVIFRSTNKPISAVVICPKSVLRDWEKKFEEWAPELRITVIAGAKKLRKHLWANPAHVYLVGYDTLLRDIHLISKDLLDLVILDEVQNIKNPKPKRTRAVKKLDARWRWGLSATPLENKVADVVNIFSYLRPGLLNKRLASQPRLVRRKIEPYFKRRRVRDVQAEIGLGEKISQLVWLELTGEQQRAYDAFLGKVRNTLKPEAKSLSNEKNKSQKTQIEVRGKVLAQISQLKLICNFDPKTKKSCKADFLEEKLAEVNNAGDKALVFSQYPNICFEDLTPRLANFNPNRFDGSLSDKERARRIEQFQTSDTNTVMLMSLKAGGVGITLTQANHVFLFDHWWNPAVAAQAIGRAYRIGQENTVFVTSLYTVGTIEEKIYRLLEHKKEMFRLVIDELSEESGLGGEDVSLTTEELLELFDLVNFDVHLKKPGREIGKTIQVVKELTHLEFRQARKLVKDCPSVILKNLPRDKANKAISRLKAAGATTELKSRPVD